MDELNKIAPELSKIKKGNPFRVPDNYFDDFSARLQMKIDAEKKILPARQPRIIQFMKPVIGLAASFALIFILVYWPLKSFMPEQVAGNNNEIEKVDNEYLAFVESIDESSFYALLDETSNSSDFSDEELINYLSANISEYDIYLGTNFSN